MKTETYHVPERRLAEVRESIEKLSKKAVKLGLDPFVLTVGEPESRPFYRYRTDDGPRYVHLDTPESLADQQKRVDEGRSAGTIVWIKFFPVTLTGQTPRLAGWEFVATLQHLDVDGEAANMLRVVPGHSGNLPARFRTATPDHCEHCNTYRRRKDTYVVRNEETGEWKQVGRNCTQVFLGGKDPHAVLKMLEYIQSAFSVLAGGGEYSGMGGSIAEAFLMPNFLAVVAACVRIDGWMSRSQARLSTVGARATADDALDILDPPEFKDPERLAEYKAWKSKRLPIDEDLALASKAIEYAHDDLDEKKDGNDYLFNLWVAVNQPTVNRKLAGITASLISHYLREVERRVLLSREQQQAANSTHIGQPKERILDRVTVLSALNRETYVLVKMITDAGNMVVWFGSSALSVGKTYDVLMTVRRHDVRNGIKQTVVNRVEPLTAEGLASVREKLAKKAKSKAAKEAKAAAEAALTPEERAARDAKKAAAAAKRAVKKAAADAAAQQTELLAKV